MLCSFTLFVYDIHHCLSRYFLVLKTLGVNYPSQDSQRCYVGIPRVRVLSFLSVLTELSHFS